MNGIYYKDGIYVLIDSDLENHTYIQHSKYKPEVSLFGGRVEIKIAGRAYIGAYADLIIDGISIAEIDKYKSFTNYLNYSVLVSHLNAIEANGVDAFLEHYKKSIEFLYMELKDMHQKTESLLASEHDNSKLKNLLSELDKIKSLLFPVVLMLFSLYSHMTAGLENEKVISVCQSIMDSLL